MDVPDFIHGNIAPVFTVFRDDEQFDETGQRNLFDYMLEQGSISCFFCRSGMGQMTEYSFEDVQAMARCAGEHLAGKVPVLMNCSGIWNRDYAHKPNPEIYTRQALELTRYAEQHGASAIVHVIPTGLVPQNPTEKQVADTYRKHFETICAVTSLPVIIYHPGVPEKIYRVTPELVRQVADIPNMVGMKVSTVDGYFIYDLLRAARGRDFHVITGAEMLYYATLPVGSRAVIGVGCNLYPRILEIELERFEQNDWDGVLEAQDSVNKLVKALPNGAFVMKSLARDAGYAVGLTARNQGRTVYNRRGLPLSPEDYQAYKKLLEAELTRYS